MKRAVWKTKLKEKVSKFLSLNLEDNECLKRYFKNFDEISEITCVEEKMEKINIVLTLSKSFDNISTSLGTAEQWSKRQ